MSIESDLAFDAGKDKKVTILLEFCIIKFYININNYFFLINKFKIATNLRQKLGYQKC